MRRTINHLTRCIPVVGLMFACVLIQVTSMCLSRTGINSASDSYFFLMPDDCTSNTASTLSDPLAINTRQSGATFTNPGATQGAGTSWNRVTFTVIYTNPDNSPPSDPALQIDDYFYTLPKTNNYDYDYTDGCVLSVTVFLASGTHSYRFCDYMDFNCSDTNTLYVVDYVTLTIIAVLAIVGVVILIGVLTSFRAKNKTFGSETLYSRPSTDSPSAN